MKSEGIRWLSLLVGFLGVVLVALLVYLSDRSDLTFYREDYIFENGTHYLFVQPPDFWEKVFIRSIFYAPVGFLVPWGIVRIIGWVYLGFVVDWKSRRDE